MQASLCGHAKVRSNPAAVPPVQPSAYFLLPLVFPPKLHYYQTNGVNPRPEEGVCACAQIKVEVDGQIEVTAGEGDGPVNALDIALRKALCRFYPAVSQIRLTDYKVRVLDSEATASLVRVLIETTDGVQKWNTVGVSQNIIQASLNALVDSLEIKLIHDQEEARMAFC